MRPASDARRPASTASFMARAMATGSRAAAMAVFISTPSQPSSMAMAASEAVPTPASTMTGTATVSRMILMLYGLRMPRPEPIGAPSGMTTAAPASSSRLATTGSSLVYGITMKPSRASVFVASRGVRQQRVTLGVDEVQDRLAAAGQAHPPDGDGDDLRPRLLVSLAHDVV